MITTPPPNTPNSPTIPLTKETRAAYEALYAECEAAIESTTDPVLLPVLNDTQADVDDILTKDTLYSIHADTNLFQELLIQINDTNATLKTLKNQIAAVASHIAAAGEIIAAIDKVLTIVPGA